MWYAFDTVNFASYAWCAFRFGNDIPVAAAAGLGFRCVKGL
jgi:hypothetical protein